MVDLDINTIINLPPMDSNLKNFLIIFARVEEIEIYLAYNGWLFVVIIIIIIFIILFLSKFKIPMCLAQEL